MRCVFALLPVAALIAGCIEAERPGTASGDTADAEGDTLRGDALTAALEEPAPASAGPCGEAIVAMCNAAALCTDPPRLIFSLGDWPAKGTTAVFSLRGCRERISTSCTTPPCFGDCDAAGAKAWNWSACMTALERDNCEVPPGSTSGDPALRIPHECLWE